MRAAPVVTEFMKELPCLELKASLVVQARFPTARPIRDKGSLELIEPRCIRPLIQGGFQFADCSHRRCPCSHGTDESDEVREIVHSSSVTDTREPCR